ncbi:hypothetical protein ACVWXB_000106 [Streptomyces sp. TE12347]
MFGRPAYQGPGAAAGHLRLHRPDGPPFRGRKWADETHFRPSRRCRPVQSWHPSAVPDSGWSSASPSPSPAAVPGPGVHRGHQGPHLRGSPTGLGGGRRSGRGADVPGFGTPRLCACWSARRLVGQPCSASSRRLVAALSASTRPGRAVRIGGRVQRDAEDGSCGGAVDTSRPRFGRAQQAPDEGDGDPGCLGDVRCRPNSSRRWTARTCCGSRVAEEHGKGPPPAEAAGPGLEAAGRAPLRRPRGPSWAWSRSTRRRTGTGRPRTAAATPAGSWSAFERFERAVIATREAGRL